jgi:hypothetical protein
MLNVKTSSFYGSGSRRLLAYEKIIIDKKIVIRQFLTIFIRAQLFLP